MAAVTADTSLFGGDRHYQNDPSAPSAHPAPGTLDDQLENELFGAQASLELDRRPRTDINIGPNAANRDRNDLGIDDEVTVRKQRKPIPKLDEERLLGPKGLPKLRGIIDKKLRFKGKGHEFSDVGRLLNLYQLWLDDLYPKAKFADGLVMIEKLGHKSRVQVTRKEWIEEAKPKSTSIEEDPEVDDFIVHKEGEDVDADMLFVQDRSDIQDEVELRNEKDIEDAATRAGITNNQSLEDDELDALLAEERDTQSSTSAKMLHQPNTQSRQDDFDDDEEAMADLGW